MAEIDCPYYYSDYRRGNETEECRLLEASPEAQGTWRRALCRTCPVPDTIRHTECDHLTLEATIQRQWMVSRVRITFALCGESMEELPDPRHCAICASSRDWVFEE